VRIFFPADAAIPLRGPRVARPKVSCAGTTGACDSPSACSSNPLSRYRNSVPSPAWQPPALMRMGRVGGYQPFFFDHLASAAFFAISLRRLGESVFARVLPPRSPPSRAIFRCSSSVISAIRRLPRATAAGFFRLFLSIARVYLNLRYSSTPKPTQILHCISTATQA